MKLFGLTGGIGTGKSTAAEFLARRGIAVVDTDILARDVVAPGEPALAEITAAFGPEVLDERGQLRRADLAQIVFADTEKRRHLESILHPAIRQRWLERVKQWRNAGLPIGIVVIPLLFETNAETEFDAVVCTACSSATQQERLRQRRWDDAEISRRIAAQWPLERKMAASRYVVWTEGSLEVHERQLARIFPSP